MKSQFSFKNQNNNLYIVATPIGNLDELSPRAIEILQETKVWIVESKLRALNLINKFNFKPTKILVSNNKNEHNNQHVIEAIINNNTVLLSDAGYPCISDPGYLLTNYLKTVNNINVIAVNGPCALTHLLSVSGFPSKPFLFYGFLDKKKNKRLLKLEQIKQLNCTFILYESCYKILTLLSEIKNVFQEVEICVAKELTKLNEQLIWGDISECIEEISQKWALKGEFSLIVNNYRK